MEWNGMQHFLLVILCFFVALLPRFIPLYIFRARKIPKWFNEWMEFVPICLFTSLVVKDLFITKTYDFTLQGHFPELISSIVVIAIAFWTRSMALSVIIGLGLVFLLSMFVF
ncbi:branched-chain amino acid transporter [Fructilactobacillus sanfranciscensis]|uniref:AzlD domain-containing protein n=1 Tax=Fructilactobacillus sanfranciscensis TaxID=1625 RepID=UPI000CD3FB14|nr:AzlD domain-containing protein [Fructilactobacillus sanfranciscensis]MCG7194820.1 AzlD domain-containing protein [Fructilactobacillus sanfranciscensis]MCG7195504.1 AzlD domain-containing protein [Fructilactobacillus sanfranciscensis]NDR97443.1 AzlD domain-containing protein [Fructilactobacillus sanfranciscensis]POH09796.1 branched-chain amino acid transporter [Fructilactobacillus sanfranciscensis]POH10166.1 branched-chain amino acid transporter [Fructilactobacillus sanfranciscensis]